MHIEKHKNKYLIFFYNNKIKKVIINNYIIYYNKYFIIILIYPLQFSKYFLISYKLYNI